MSTNSNRIKVRTVGGATYVGGGVVTKRAPKKCIRDGVVCAFRMKVTGMTNGPQTSACGYMYYTGKTRGKIVEPDSSDKHIKYSRNRCDLWEEEIPNTALVNRIREEDYVFDE